MLAASRAHRLLLSTLEQSISVSTTATIAPSIEACRSVRNKRRRSNAEGFEKAKPRRMSTRRKQWANDLHCRDFHRPAREQEVAFTKETEVTSQYDASDAGPPGKENARRGEAKKEFTLDQGPQLWQSTLSASSNGQALVYVIS